MLNPDSIYQLIPIWGDWYGMVIASLFLVSPFVITYAATSVISFFKSKQKAVRAEPPPVPYSIPFMGNLLSFASDTKSYMSYMTFE